jgi:catechol 2,3-dioxygenase-like lactoylglutathione lyase family enzyme
LGFEVVEQREETVDGVEAITGVFGVRRRIVAMRLGDERIELTDYLAPEGQPLPTDFRSNDRWFQHVAIVVADMDRAYAHLRAHNVRHASTGPQTLPASNPNAGGIRAFYFKDPDGHPLEAIWFPEGKGDPRWKEIAREHSSRLFLGIDHTAIVVADTDKALSFYRDALGLRIAGESENIGIEQARLNNVRGAHLRITGLRAPRGIGVELLEYLEPGTGRPYPANAGPNDLIHYETLVETRSVERAAAISARATT